MSASVETDARRTRKSRLPAGPVGARLVMSELVKRGFDAEVAASTTLKYDVIIRFDRLPPRPVQVRTVHVSPWYVRTANFAGAAARNITVYVLLGDQNANSTRFFVVRNDDLTGVLHQPSNWNKFGLIYIESLEKYENNWDSLKTVPGPMSSASEPDCIII
jgi:hypothetical protein